MGSAGGGDESASEECAQREWNNRGDEYIPVALDAELRSRGMYDPEQRHERYVGVFWADCECEQELSVAA